jgi:hypothetical protein
MPSPLYTSSCSNASLARRKKKRDEREKEKKERWPTATLSYVDAGVAGEEGG